MATEGITGASPMEGAGGDYHGYGKCFGDV